VNAASVFVPPGFSPELTAFLGALHQEVMESLGQFAADPNRSSGQNAKGDIQRAFDVEIDRLVRRRLAECFPSGILTTEEGTDERFGSPPPQVRLVVDRPMAGYRAGLAYSSLCISAFPPEGPLDLARQQWAFIGDISANCRVGPAVRRTAPAHHLGDDGGPALAGASWSHPTTTHAIFAARGHGAWRGRERLQTSGQTQLAEASISVQLSHSPKQPQLLELFAAARTIRSYGSSSHDIGLVAAGQLDAHVDIRGRWTPESFLAACLAAEEAGGCIVGPSGKRLPPYERLTDRASLIVAATPELAREIVAVLSRGA
jgi:fructose-1,6-bisphosphatase/inositol monophosphatase family enzyme